MSTHAPASIQSSLPGPLRVMDDMQPVWSNVDEDFDTAAERVIAAHAADGAARDLPVLDLRTWGVVPYAGQFALAPLAKHHPPRPLRSTGFSNLAARLGAPVEFVRDRLPAPLQIATLNWLLTASHQPINGVLRLRDDEVSAIVSERYAPLDAPELMDAIRAALIQHEAIDQVRIRSVATGTVDVIRLIFPAAETAIKVGDVTSLGIDISSSSFGRSAVHVRGLLWRLKCTNGLRVAERHGAFSFRHIGETQRLRDGIAEAIPSALMAAKGTMARWKAAVDIMVEDVAAELDRLRELTIPERKLVEEEMKNEAGVAELPEHTDLFTFVSGITAAAREAVPSRRIEMESLAGELLTQRTRGHS